MAKKLTLDLSVFKSSGVYTLEFDASENIVINPQTVRLVVGFSTKGPFNTPVYLPDLQTAIKVFGDIDRALEKKGSFFHRSIFTCLNSGPVFALNLLKLNNTVTETGTPDVANGSDVARYRTFSLDTGEANGPNSADDYTRSNALLTKQDKLVSSYYNREKFFFPDPNMLLATIDTAEKSKLLSLVNLSQNPISVIIKKSVDARIPIRGFDITAQEYFGTNNIPPFVNPNDYIQDYFVDVIAVSGNWSKYSDLSLDPIYSSFFTSKGFVKSRIDDFLALNEVNVILTTTGCLIPDFIDQNGITQYVKTLINNQVGQSGILCAINEEALDDLENNGSFIDLVGHSLTGALDPGAIQNNNIDFLSYSSPLIADFSYSVNSQTVNDLVTPTSTPLVTTFNVTNSGASAYIINGNSNPTLTLNGGETYTFNINSPNHPFVIKTIAQTGFGNAYTNGVTINSGIATTYNITVVNDGTANVFVVSGQQKPPLNLVRGGIYTFDQSAATNVGHQIAFKNGDGNSYTSGVITTGVLGQAGAKTVITVPFDAPDDLRYYCVAHGNYMGNTISVSSGIGSGTITFEVPYNAPSTLYYICQIHGAMKGVINIIDVPEQLPNYQLLEVGTTYEDSLASSGISGINSADFQAYSASNADAGLPYIQTNFQGVTAGNRKSALREFLSISPTSSAPKFILGKVTSTLAGNVEARKFFNDGDIVKLRIEEVKEVTVSPGNVQVRIKWSHPLFRSNTPLVEPYDETNLSSGKYQFCKSDYFDLVDPIETSPGSLGSPVIIENQIIGNFNYFGYSESKLYTDWDRGLISDGDVIHKTYNGSLVQFVKFEKSIDRDGFSVIELKAYVDSDLTTQETVVGLGLSYLTNATGPEDTVEENGFDLNIVSLVGNLNQFIEIESIPTPNVQVEMTLINVRDSGLVVGDLLVSEDIDPITGSNRLARVLISKRNTTGPGEFSVFITTDRPIKIYSGQRVNKFIPIHKFVSNLNFTYLPGFQLKNTHKPNGSDDRLDEILNVLTETNIAKTLSDRNIITFRYVVDTFDGQIQTDSKQQLANLAKNRQKCLALINAPSMEKFKNSIDPRFTGAPSAVDPAPLLNARFIVDGGNLDLNPSFRFTLPSEDNGAKFCGVFAPFLTIRENGKNFNIPPAAHVSNNFIRKFVTGEPYSIVAGQKRGILSGSNLVGLEYDFSQEDRDFLEPFGINPIVRKRNIGLVIFGNQTGFQRTNSAFNNLHVRDLLITLEESVEDILANFLFDFNEDSIRLEIKTLVDNYLSGVKNVGGIFNFLTIMDSSNNTPAVIDQNIGIIDIIVEPARGIHKFINRMTVARTGGIASGGFIQFS